MDSPRKLFDGGACTSTRPTAAHAGMKYGHAGKESTYSIGPYGSEKDEHSLASAREQLGQVKAWLAQGLDPNVERKAGGWSLHQSCRLRLSSGSPS